MAEAAALLQHRCRVLLDLVELPLGRQRDVIDLPVVPEQLGVLAALLVGTRTRPAQRDGVFLTRGGALVAVLEHGQQPVHLAGLGRGLHVVRFVAVVVVGFGVRGQILEREKLVDALAHQLDDRCVRGGCRCALLGEERKVARIVLRYFVALLPVAATLRVEHVVHLVVAHVPIQQKQLPVRGTAARRRASLALLFLLPFGRAGRFRRTGRGHGLVTGAAAADATV
uniref:(northern house mosquito) hypothetical protein n=1 Tax=Culex pipiens TaxID=7175 RepID=A0A8D8A027_CULPI